MNHQLESRLLGEISITSDMQMPPHSLMAESEKELNSLLIKMKQSEKASLKLNIQKMKIITRQSGWLLSKSLQAINAGEGVEKREPSYTVGGNAN